jgi:hypothetical protein
MCDEARRIIEGDLGPGQGPTKIMRAALPLSFGVRENWRSSHLFWTIRLSRLAARPLPSPRVFVRDHGRKDCRQAVVVLCHSGQTPPRCRRPSTPTVITAGGLDSGLRASPHLGITTRDYSEFPASWSSKTFACLRRTNLDWPEFFP